MKMLPRLHAQEQLSAIDVAALAAGGYEKHDARTMMERLRQATTGDARQEPAKIADPSQLAAMGIGMTIMSATSAEARNDG